MAAPTIFIRRSIRQTFDILRARKKIGLIPFVPAGYPDLSATAAVLKALDTIEPAVIEIGFPFSDPVADGPIIQEAFTAALSHHLKVADIFKTVAGVSPGIAAPLVAMMSYSIVYRYGPTKFFADARAAGFSGMIIPDLPPPEAEKTCQLIRAADLDTILLVAPTTTSERRREIARLSSGFVYYLSVSGITGERDALPSDLASGVAEMRSLTDRPVCVGFGISKPKHIHGLESIADGAIVGSAIVKRMKEHAAESSEIIAGAVLRYCQELMA